MLPPDAGTLAVGEVVLIVTDVVITTNSMSNASGVGGADENPQLAMLNTMADEIYLHPLLHLPEFGEDSTELIAATNHLIDCANSFNQHNAAHEPQEILSLDLLAMANALDLIADELDDLGVGSTEFSGQQLSDIQHDLMSDGLPQSEVDYLQDAGFSRTFIANFHSLHGGEDYTSVITVTLSTAMRRGASEIRILVDGFDLEAAPTEEIVTPNE